MASANLSEELNCSLCLDIYTDPVNLKCGHNFCRVCIDRVLDSQEGSAGYSCPECREKYTVRPGLHRNIALRSIAERFKGGVCCTYCVDTYEPAVMSCLHCDASMCDNHLRDHSKAPEHALCTTTISLETRKCSIHKKILEYYCTEDAACVCVTCTLAGEHRGHQVETLQEASEKKTQKLMAETEEAEKRVQSLEELKRKTQIKADGEAERVTALFRDLRRQLEELEKRVLSDISRQAEQMSQSYDDVIQQLEIKKKELSRKIRHIEELCNMNDQLIVLQESDTGDLWDTEDRHDKQLHSGGDMDVAGISHTLHTGLSDIMYGVTGGISIKPADILLDLNTANDWLHISDDRKTASLSHRRQNRPETPERFKWYSQVLSSRSFSSGQYYWEVNVRASDEWRVGMCYPSIGRRGGGQSVIGDNNKSWCLERWDNQYLVRHDSEEIKLPHKIPSDSLCRWCSQYSLRHPRIESWLHDKILSDRVRIYLDYEAGQISFYALCDPIRHLHTFTVAFTEPLYAAVWVGGGGVKLSGGNQDE
ncbi:E3 ubiquitin-protein ligase TRIM39-like [Hyperolius riggenbachi]|uniref:E3 ubiquitin-protein ligase TRIM39-like n=1 Tax=Hyperolius riggenbachi TaxID=752182 RepID=UPI0035A38F50